MRARRAGDRRRRLGRAGREAGRRADGAALGRAPARRSCASRATSCSAGRRRACSSAAREAVEAAKRHPLARALRIDKLSLAALEATLRLHRDAPEEIPVLAMLHATPRGARGRGPSGSRPPSAARSSRASRASAAARCRCSSCPARSSRSPDASLAAALRAGDPPVLGRIEDDRLLLDPRTLTDDEVDLVAAAIAPSVDLSGLSPDTVFLVSRSSPAPRRPA